MKSRSSWRSSSVARFSAAVITTRRRRRSRWTESSIIARSCSVSSSSGSSSSRRARFRLRCPRFSPWPSLSSALSSTKAHLPLGRRGIEGLLTGERRIRNGSIGREGRGKRVQTASHGRGTIVHSPHTIEF
jgi:hypothetical protein